MGNAERFAASAREELAGDRFARSERDGMNQSVEPIGPVGTW